jgi:hypothetical protein
VQTGHQLLPALDGTHHGEYSVLMRRQFGTEFETGGDSANQEEKPCRSS